MALWRKKNEKRVEKDSDTGRRKVECKKLDVKVKEKKDEDKKKEKER